MSASAAAVVLCPEEPFPVAGLLQVPRAALPSPSPRLRVLDRVVQGAGLGHWFDLEVSTTGPGDHLVCSSSLSMWSDRVAPWPSSPSDRVVYEDGLARQSDRAGSERGP